MKKKLTPWEQEDVNKRIAAFEEDYEKLMKKHECYHSTFPQYFQIAPGTFTTGVNFLVIDSKYAPKEAVESPYNDKIIEG